MVEHPAYLQPSDKVALLSPSRYWEDNDASKLFVDWASKQGWEVVFSPNLGKKSNQLGGSDDQRFFDIKWALENPEIKAVFAARGGYGAIRLLSKLENLDFKSQPKWWVGFSDFTVVHNVLQNQGVPSIHGPMSLQWSSNPKQIQNTKILQSVLKGEVVQWEADRVNSDFLRPFHGKLVGGNLSILYALSAAGRLKIEQGDVLLIEDLDEYLYHIDRMIQALDIFGVFSKISALVVGSMSDMHDNPVPFGKTPQEIIIETVEQYQIPVIFNAPIGHESINYAVKLGMDCIFDGQFFKQP